MTAGINRPPTRGVVHRFTRFATSPDLCPGNDGTEPRGFWGYLGISGLLTLRFPACTTGTQIPWHTPFRTPAGFRRPVEAHCRARLPIHSGQLFWRRHLFAVYLYWTVDQETSCPVWTTGCRQPLHTLTNHVALNPTRFTRHMPASPLRSTIRVGRNSSARWDYTHMMLLTIPERPGPYSKGCGFCLRPVSEN